MKGATGADEAIRVALDRRRGRFTLRPQFSARLLCGVLSRYKLGRTVFGGSRRSVLPIAIRLRQQAKVRLLVRRDGKDVRTIDLGTIAANKTIRRRLSSRRLKRDDYTVTAIVEIGSLSLSKTLTARRL